MTNPGEMPPKDKIHKPEFFNLFEGFKDSEKLEMEANLDVIIGIRMTQVASVANLLTELDLLIKIKRPLNKLMEKYPRLTIEDLRLALKKDTDKIKDR